MDVVEEANRAAIDSCHGVLNLLSQPQGEIQYGNLSAETRQAVSKFKRVSSLLGKTLGHARFRMGKKCGTPMPQKVLFGCPVSKADLPNKKHVQLLHDKLNEFPRPNDNGSTGKSSLSWGNPSIQTMSSNGRSSLVHSQATSSYYQFAQQQQQSFQLHQQQLKHHQAEMWCKSTNGGIDLNFDGPSCNPTMSSTRSFVSSLSIDGSVANLDSSGFNLNVAAYSGHISGQKWRKCCFKGEDGNVKCGSASSRRCHCTKKRKHRVKRTIKVPAISNKIADIPSDEYSWRKYGQKPIKGSPYPRGYYKCSSMRGCPARKHVERCVEDPSMLVVTYEDEHNHPRLPSHSANTKSGENDFVLSPLEVV